MKKYDLIIYIGRFQPYHVAHQKTIEYARTLAKDVLVLVGSAENSISPKNPFTFDQRKKLILEDTGSINVSVLPIKDHTYDNPAWIKEVGATVLAYMSAGNKISGDMKIGIIGHDKDHSSFYLNYFSWDFIEVPAYPEKGETIDATKIRNLLFSDNIQFIAGVVPENVFRFLFEYYESSIFIELKREWVYIEKYKKDWAAAPYAPTFVTVDSVVVQSGHVLLVKRGQDAGIGLWAIAGGFINQFEPLQDAAVRELQEETKIKLQTDVLCRSITHRDVFDHPNRSSRGRTITHAYLFELNDAKPLPKVKGADDAAEAKWFSFAEFAKMESVMFEDHFHIVNHMMNKI